MNRNVLVLLATVHVDRTLERVEIFQIKAYIYSRTIGDLLPFKNSRSIYERAHSQDLFLNRTRF